MLHRFGLFLGVLMVLAGCSDDSHPIDSDAGMDGSVTDGGNTDGGNTDGGNTDGAADLGRDLDTADGTTDMTDVDASLPTSASFNVVASLTYDSSGGGGSPPSSHEHDFTIFVDAIGSGSATGLFGAYGESVLKALTTGSASNELSLASQLSIRFENLSATACGTDGPIRYDSMSITLTDSNHDGNLELTGTAEGEVSSFGGDVIWSTPFTATLTGAQEYDGPSITRVINTGEPIHPIDRVTTVFNEPLSTVESAVWHSDAGDVAMQFESATGPAMASTSGVFPWGSTFTPVITGATDFTGAAFGGSLPSLTSISDPGILAELDFEAGSIHAYLANSARREDVASFGFDTTNFALYVPSGGYDSELAMYVPAGRATMRVTIPGAPTYLYFDMALVLNDGVTFADFFGRISIVAVSNGTHLDVTIPDFPADSIVNNHTGFVPVEVFVDGAVPAGETELIFDVVGDGVSCGFRPPPPRGVLIDNIRFVTEG